MSTTSFSRSSVNRRLRTNLGGSLNAAVKQVQAIGRAAESIANEFGGLQAPSLRDALDSIGLRGLPLPSLARARACGTPECHCPSPDLGEVRKVVDRPEKVSVGFRFRNGSGARRTFDLQAGSITAETGEAGGAVAVSPNSLDLGPGEIGVVRVDVDASQHRRGVDYVGAVKVSAKSCEDMTLTVVVAVEPETDVLPIVDLHCCCHPKVRPLRWYHHYYCDPPPEDRQPNRSPNNPDHPPG